MTPIAADKSSMEKGQAKPQILLHHHLKALRLPTFLSQYEKVTDAAYARRGWTKNGVPKVATLKRLGIDLPELVAIVQADQED